MKTLLRIVCAIALVAPAFPGICAAQETVCIQCHGAQPGRLGEPVALWRGSVHEANGVSCVQCHGGDPSDFAMAMSPERGFLGAPTEEKVPEFCGRCHVGVKEDYLQSAHGGALGAGGPTCVTCHGSHAVVPASLNLINSEDCSRCHDYGRAEEIRNALVGTEAAISDLQTRVADLHRIGIETSRLEAGIFSARNDFRRLFHSVDVEKVRGETSAIQEQLQEIAARVDALKDELNQRKLWGAGIVLLLLIAGVLGLLLHRSYMEEERP